MSDADSSQESSGALSQGSLSPEEEEQARLMREARREQQATVGQGQPSGSMGLAGNEEADSAATQHGDSGFSNDARDFAARAVNELDRSTDSGSDAVGGLFHGLGRGLNYVVEKTTNAVNAAGGQAADLTSATASALGNAGGTISNIASTVADSASSGALTLANNAAGAAGPLGNAAGAALSGASHAAGQVAGVVSNVDLSGVAGAATSVAGGAVQAAGSIAGNLAGAVGSLPLGEILGASGEVLGAVAGGAGEVMGEVVGGVLGAVLDNL